MNGVEVMDENGVAGPIRKLLHDYAYQLKQKGLIKKPETKSDKPKKPKLKSPLVDSDGPQGFSTKKISPAEPNSKSKKKPLPDDEDLSIEELERQLDMKFGKLKHDDYRTATPAGRIRNSRVNEDDEDGGELEFSVESVPQAGLGQKSPSAVVPSGRTLGFLPSTPSKKKAIDDENDSEDRKLIKKKGRLPREQGNFFPNAHITQAIHKQHKKEDTATLAQKKVPGRSHQEMTQNKPPVIAPTENSKNEVNFDDFDSDVSTEALSYTRRNDEKTKKATPSVPALGGFRLRAPSPAELQARTLTAERQALRLKQQEEARMAKKKALRESSKTAFKPFYFPNETEYEEDETKKGSHHDIFATESSFAQLLSPDSMPNLDDATRSQILDNLHNLLQMQVPTVIQSIAVPLITSSSTQHTILQAQTGSGKTLAFLLPLLQRLQTSSTSVQAIVLAPSRELVLQIHKVAQLLFADTVYRSVALIGGANPQLQRTQLRDVRPQVIIATPGRLAEMAFKYEKLRLSNVRTIVIDEVDHLLQDIFVDEVRTIVEATPLMRSHRSAQSSSRGRNRVETEEEYVDRNQLLAEIAADPEDVADRDIDAYDTSGSNSQQGLSKRQNTLMVLASATAQSDERVKTFLQQYIHADTVGMSLKNPGWQVAAIAQASLLPRRVTHGLISVPRVKALEMLRKLLRSTSPAVQRAFIFVNDPHRVEIITNKLFEMGIIAAPLHGMASKDDRKEVLARILDGRLQYVVTTELAARGLDIPELSHVINFELPTDAPHYVHR